MADADGKTLVFSFDGTGNEPSDADEFQEDESISNVLKLHILMGGGINEDESDTRTPEGKQQSTFYFNGIGTREDGWQVPLLGRLFSFGQKLINQAIAPRFGDARRILNEAMRDFKEADYQSDDTLVILGFSRGAALARKFASMILEEHTQCRVSFLGVFDTVSAMGGMHRKGERISSHVVFENGTLNERIDRAVHIVSLDESRVSFEPTLINKDDGNPGRILEVWFPGVHSDIGGGYWFDGLSDGALTFMIAECKKTLGNRISIKEGNYAAIHGLLESQKSELADLEVDDIAINPLVHGILHANSGVTTIPGQEPRAVYVSDNDARSQDPKDLPLVNYSVKERFDTVAGYRPAALRGRIFKLLRDGKISEPLHGISQLRGEVQFPS